MRDRIEIDPDIMTGKPIIKGTRIPVERIIQLLAHGVTTEELLEEYPNLEKKDIQAALKYAADTLEEESVFRMGGEDFEVSNDSNIEDLRGMIEEDISSTEHEEKANEWRSQLSDLRNS